MEDLRAVQAAMTVALQAGTPLAHRNIVKGFLDVSETARQVLMAARGDPQRIHRTLGLLDNFEKSLIP
ncbi:hypothetical protein V5O48_019039, partial [Marasmius crinis-equi]